jgi:hypothetical protein
VFAQLTSNHLLLVTGQQRLRKPSASALREQLALIGWDQVRMEHRLNVVLQPRELANQLRSLGDRAPSTLGLTIGNPDFW